MQKDTHTTYTLNRADIREALIAWLRDKGETITDGAYVMTVDDIVVDTLLVLDQARVIAEVSSSGAAK